MELNPFLNFDGRCTEAFHYYEEHLGAVITSRMTFAELPDAGGVDPAWNDRVLHATLSLAGTNVMGSDVQGAQPMRSAYLSLGVDRRDDAERIYAALADGGEVFMPLHTTFFAALFAQLRDRFGVNWMIVFQGP